MLYRIGKGFYLDFALTAGAPLPTCQPTKLCLASFQKPLRHSYTTHAHLLTACRQHHINTQVAWERRPVRRGSGHIHSLEAKGQSLDEVRGKVRGDWVGTTLGQATPQTTCYSKGPVVPECVPFHPDASESKKIIQSKVRRMPLKRNMGDLTFGLN